MALLKLGGLVEKISGKLGGQILGTSPNGSYIKTNAYSQQHPTPAQSKQRTSIYPIPQLWRSLTQAQRDDWAAEVPNYPYINKVGDTVEYTPYQLFLFLNQNLNTIDLPPNLTVPTFEASETVGAYINNPSSNYIEVRFTETNTDVAVKIYVSPWSEYALKPPLSKFFFLDTYYTPTISTHYVISTAYANKFGYPPSGTFWHYHFQGIVRATGIPSAIYDEGTIEAF